MIQKILVPVDFSEGSLAALQKAGELARITGAELVVLHADEFPVVPSDGSGYLPSYVVQEHEAAVKRRLVEVSASVSEPGVSVRNKLVMGPAHGAIIDAAAELGVGLIVMGTHGRRGFRHLALGSVAERVARTSKVPVMTVRAANRAG